MVEIEFTRLKKAVTNEFKGRKLLDIRNYYEKDDEIKPTQKGISLTGEEWLSLLEHMDEISAALGVNEPVATGGKKSARKRKHEDPIMEPLESSTPKAEPNPAKKQLSPEKVSAEDLANDIA